MFYDISIGRSNIKLQIWPPSGIVYRVSIKPWASWIIIRISEVFSLTGIVNKIGFPVWLFCVDQSVIKILRKFEGIIIAIVT